MKQLFLLISILILSCATCIAQDLMDFAPDFGKYNVEELEMKKYEKDTTAEAVVLYDRGKTAFRRVENGFNIVFLHTQRIKILKKAGLTWATFEIPYYVDEYIFEEVNELSGFTYNKSDNQYEKTPLDLKTVYVEDKANHWKIKKFSMPNVKEGSVIELFYSISSPYFFNFRGWKYQKSIPVIYSEYVTQMIPFYTYHFIAQGINKFDGYHAEASIATRKFFNTEFSDMNYTFVMKDVPAFKDEAFITCPEDYIMKQDFQLTERTDLSGVKTSVMNTWPKFIKELLKMSEIGGYMKDANSNGKKLLESMNLSLKKPMEQIQTLDEYMKSNFNWDGYRSIYANKSVRKFQETKTGNTAEINLYFVGLLKSAGLDAFPVILSTRDHGKIVADYPFEHFFNYVVAAVKVDSTFMLFDATEPLGTFGVLPERCINDKGLALKNEKDKDKFDWINLSLTNKSTINYSIDLVPDLKTKSIKGDFRIVSNGYFANESRNNYLSDPESYKKSLIASNYVIQDTVRVKNALESNKSINFIFSAKANMNVFDDKITFMPFCSFVESVNPLRQPTRTYPIDMIYKQEKVFQTVIHIPEGYKLMHSPANINIDNEDYKLQLSTETLDQSILKIVGSYELKKEQYPSTKYDKIKDFFRLMVDRFNDEVVLQKI
ncbi:MAG TPA: transglutaminase domain-containing protein [Bacteroidales bacterium]